MLRNVILPLATAQANQSSRPWPGYVSCVPMCPSPIRTIFTGVTGLVSVKNLVEIGFDVTGFERNDYFGGLWQYNEDPTQTTVLKCKYGGFCLWRSNEEIEQVFFR